MLNPRRAPRVVALSIVLVAAAMVNRAPTAAHASVLYNVGYVSLATPVTGPGPLKLINVGIDTTMQVVDVRPSQDGEFYNPSRTNCTGDLGVYVSLGSALYGPNPAAAFHCKPSHLPTPTYAFTPVSQTVGGAGTPASPYTVTTTVRVTGTVSLIQTVRYATGQNTISETNTLKNTGTSPVHASIFNAGEPDPGSIDTGYGYYDPATGAVGGANPIATFNTVPRVVGCGAGIPTPYAYQVYFTPVTPWQHSMVDSFNNVFVAVSNTRFGIGIPDTHNTGCIDPAMAVQWDVTVAPGSSASVAKAIVFNSTFPPLSAGTVGGKATCSSITWPAVTCQSDVPLICPACGSSFSFMLPVGCASGQFNTIDLVNRSCGGTMNGHIGLPTYLMAVKSGGIQTVGPGVVQALLSGTGTFGNMGAGFTAVLTDNEVTGVDTVTLAVTYVGGSVTNTWTCTNVPSCLEVFPSL